jgi:membrane protein YqaA with SNARE-associated domain
MDFLFQLGYLGLFLGTFLAATVLPFSSEILVTGMLYAGANPLWVCIIATLGNWLGSVSTYGLGLLGKLQWIEKIFKITPEKIEKQQRIIQKFGSWIALVVWLPGIGDLLSLALGFYKVSPYKCIPFMLIGKALRFITVIFLYKFITNIDFGF